MPAGAPNSLAISLANLPATSRQRRLVFVLAVVQLVVFGIVTPFAATPLPRFDAFLPSLVAMIFVNDLITSILLFAQYVVNPSRALLVLASGYLFTSLIVIPHAIAFPGVLSPTGVGPQTAASLYTIWHVGAPAAIIGYACLKDSDRASDGRDGSARIALVWSVAIVILLVCGLTWLAFAGEKFLPVMHVDIIRINQGVLVYTIVAITILFSAIALASLWMRRRSVLDYWLMLVVCAFISEEVLLGFFVSSRFDLGYYIGRTYSLATSIFVLMMLLAETTKLYARLARANMTLEHERANKLMSIEAVTASISHEVRQPLASIMASGEAALALLEKTPPDLAEARESLNEAIDEIQRADDLLVSTRSLFRSVDKERRPVDFNEIALEAIQSMRSELNVHNVTVRWELITDMPLVDGNRHQLQQVILNLVHNALDAMDSITDRSRVLWLKTERRGRDEVVVSVQDSGPGIDPKRLDDIFDVFVTTKAQGTGLGLAICRTIIERHGGHLTASSDGNSGTLFQLVLPIKSPPLAPRGR
jgi:signal transduction histidine kinase